MKLSSEQETICKVFRERRSGGVNCYRCPMALSVRDCICLKMVSEEEAKANWDWDGSPYPALEKSETWTKMTEKEKKHEGAIYTRHNIRDV